MRVIPSVDRMIVSSRWPQEEYGSWSEEMSCSVIGVRHDEHGEGGIEDAYLIADGSTEAHVLAVTYADGDSFGSATGKLAIIHVFGDRQRAEAALAGYEASPTGESFTFEDDFGRSISMSDPAGCDSVFSSRSDVSITTLPIL